MAEEILMPKLGLTMTEGTVDTWLKQVGETVKQGEAVCTISSEKLTHDVESPLDGILLEILVMEGEEVPCKTPLGIVGVEGEKVVSNNQQQKQIKPEEQTATNLASTPETSSIAPTITRQKRIFITPLARKISQANEIDYTQITGTGGNGRITRRDVERTLAQEKARVKSAPKLVKDTVSPGIGLSGMRKVIAERMYTSLHNTAQVTLQENVDITELMQFRTEMKKRLGDDLIPGQLSLTTFVTKAVAKALVSTPDMNAWYASGQYERVTNINIGIAVALEEGLVVPVIKMADQRSMSDLAQVSQHLIKATRAGELLPEEATDGTFTITNLGKSQVEYFTPVLNTPEIGILGVGGIKKVPTFDKFDQVVPSYQLPLSLTFDHQVIDGAPAADFLDKIANLLRDPYKLIL